MSTNLQQFSRREFIRVASAAAGLFALNDLAGCSSDTPNAGAGLPSLGGAPNTDEGRTIAAFVDTVVPGRYRDPKGAPGGIDVGAPGLFFDPTLPALPFVPLLVLVLDSQAALAFNGASFQSLTVAQRETVILASLDAAPQVDFAMTLAKLAYFSSDGAAKYLGYPGANNGYINDPNFSFGTALTTEITSDGNLP
jgi:hypothetical protein